jgi:hypothetical protein
MSEISSGAYLLGGFIAFVQKKYRYIDAVTLQCTAESAATEADRPRVQHNDCRLDLSNLRQRLPAGSSCDEIIFSVQHRGQTLTGCLSSFDEQHCV